MSQRRHTTRIQAIAAHADRYMHETSASWQTYVANVVMHYHEHTPEAHRRIEFHVTGDAFRDFDKDSSTYKKIRRMLKNEGDTRAPIELEESLVGALPEPYVSNCRRELMARYGCLDVQIPIDSQHAWQAIEGVAKFTSGAGQALQALSPVIADGVIDEQDAEHVPAALEAIDSVIAIAQGLRAQLCEVKSNPRRPTKAGNLKTVP